MWWAGCWAWSRGGGQRSAVDVDAGFGRLQLAGREESYRIGSGGPSASGLQYIRRMSQATVLDSGKWS
jgi:hypothetical protein